MEPGDTGMGRFAAAVLGCLFSLSGGLLADEGQDEEVKAVAGFRIFEFLFWGKNLYVDDLVTKNGKRSKGYGGALFDWLVDYARAAGCEAFRLDSGVQRFAAHRFYLSKRMNIAAHHFTLSLND